MKNQGKCVRIITGVFIGAALFCFSSLGLMGQSVTFEGTWTNTTFNSMGSSTFTVTTNGPDISLTFDLGGGVFGMGDPPAVTIAGQVTPTGIEFHQEDHAFFGDISIMAFLDGTFRMEFNNVPSANIDRQVATGTLTREDLKTNYEVFFTGGGSAEGVGDVDLESGSLPFLDYLPQYGNGDNFTSDVVAINPTDQLVNAFALLTDDDGNPLDSGLEGLLGEDGVIHLSTVPLANGNSVVNFQVPPLDSVTLRSDGLGPLQVGAAVIAGAADLGAVIRFAFPASGIAGVGSAQRSNRFIIPARRTAGDIDTGIALYNPNSMPVDVTMTLRSGGQDVAVVILEDLAGFGHIARFISELFPGVDTSNFEGSVIFQGSDGKQLAAVAIELGNDPGEFTTLPVTPID